MSALVGIFAFFLGLILGSFFNVCIFRIPDDRPFWGGRSRCRHCNKVVPWNLNIPVLSYLLLHGRTRCCHKRLAIQYPLVETGTGVLFLVLFLKFGATWHWVVYAVLSSWLLVISVIDIHHRIIPDELSLSGIVLGFLASFLTGDISWSSSLIGTLLGGGSFFAVGYLYEKLAGREGLGGGDVKLLAMLGAWFGVESILLIIVLSTFFGSLFGIALMGMGRANSKAAIPFGPFLAIAAFLYLFMRKTLLPFFYPMFYSS